MKTTMKNFYRTVLDLQQLCSTTGFLHRVAWRGRALAVSLSVVLGLALNAPAPAAAAEDGKTFSTPEEAVAALRAAANSTNADAYQNLFGSAAADLENPDPEKAAAEHQSFTAALNATNFLVHV